MLQNFVERDDSDFSGGPKTVARVVLVLFREEAKSAPNTEEI